jgi:hypothetical protein
LETTGCCGEKELIKFEAFRLTQHPAVIIMDADMLVLRPLDEVIDLILDNNNPGPEVAARHLQNTSSGEGSHTARGDVWLLYVHDYNMAEPPYVVTPSQGGLAIIKPNRTIYEEIRQIVLRGDFHETYGWGNVTGTFLGSMTYQGLLPYYFQILNKGRALALDWCRHDNMVTPRSEGVKRGNETVERCFTHDCQDCSTMAWEDVYSFHFTICYKPWHCVDHNLNPSKCELMHRAWFQHRSELEESWGRPGRGSSNGTINNALGYCSQFGGAGYEAIGQPYGAPV